MIKWWSKLNDGRYPFRPCSPVPEYQAQLHFPAFGDVKCDCDQQAWANTDLSPPLENLSSMTLQAVPILWSLPMNGDMRDLETHVLKFIEPLIEGALVPESTLKWGTPWIKNIYFKF